MSAVSVIMIDDAEDPRLEPYRQVRERDLAGRTGLFVAEGEVVLRTLLSGRARFACQSVLVTRSRAERLGSVLARLQPDAPVYVVPPVVMAGVAGFPIHRGVLALGRRGPDGTTSELLPGSTDPALVLGLVGLTNHDNVGGAFRNAAAFGADAVLLDGRCCDPLYRKAIRVSVGACLTVPFAREPDPAALAGTLARAGFEILALSPRGREPLADVRWPDRAALLVGTEGEGLPEPLLARLRTVRIAMAPGVDSLNVATASGIALASAHAARSVRNRTLGD